MKPTKTQMKKEKEEEIKSEFESLIEIAKSSTKNDRSAFNGCRSKFWNKLGRLQKLMAEMGFELDAVKTSKLEIAKRKMA